ncbi:MAG: hypothetical protein E6Q76_14340 [Rhizobium sp.]|nr:MAG: hypothetical protein E6Q76_14340 [Rhizobium sp.]
MNILLMRWSAIGAVLLTAFMLYSAYGLHKQKKVKVDQQEQINGQLSKFKTMYDGLRPSEKKWLDSYPTMSSVSDLLGLYDLLGIPAAGLMSYRDDISFNGTMQLSQNDVDLSLRKFSPDGVFAGGHFVALGESFTVDGTASAPSFRASLQSVEGLTATFTADDGKSIMVQYAPPVTP